MVRTDFDEELALVFEEAASVIAAFPPHLAAYGLKLLDRAHPLREAGDTNSLFGLLPFWLRERWDVPLRACRDLAVGNVFLTLHFSLLDDAMDAAVPGSDGPRTALPFGQLCQEAFRERYGRCDCAPSLLWARYREYVADWAASVSLEGQEGRRADPRNPKRLAGKAAPLKVCAAGILLMAGRREELPALEEAMDLALAVLQLADDWADWRDDLAGDGADASAFLVLVREKLALPDGEPLMERAVKQAIYRHQVLDLLADQAEAYAGRLRSNPSVAKPLVDYTAALAAGIRRDARRADEAAAALALEGGWSYFLSNIL